MDRFAVVLLVVITFLSVASSAQSQRESYQHLSARGRDLVAPLVDSGYPAQDYDSWRQSERTTFEAIVHALEDLEISHLVERMDVPWGVSRSTDGRDQYRLSVTLKPGAVEEIRGNENFTVLPVGGHVKLPNGHVVGRLVAPWSFITAAVQTATARQKRPRGSRRASVQISWLRSDERTADIDIDYLAIEATNHNKPFNSDVRFGSHHEIHNRTFGQPPPLTDWWR